MLLEAVIKRHMDQIEAFTLAIYIHNELKYNQPENSAKKQKAKSKKQKKRLPLEMVTFLSRN